MTGELAKAEQGQGLLEQMALSIVALDRFSEQTACFRDDNALLQESIVNYGLQASDRLVDLTRVLLNELKGNSLGVPLAIPYCATAGHLHLTNSKQSLCSSSLFVNQGGMRIEMNHAVETLEYPPYSKYGHRYNSSIITVMPQKKKPVKIGYKLHQLVKEQIYTNTAAFYDVADIIELSFWRHTPSQKAFNMLADYYMANGFPDAVKSFLAEFSYLPQAVSELIAGLRKKQEDQKKALGEHLKRVWSA